LEKIKIVSTGKRNPTLPAVPVVIPTVPNRLRNNSNNNNNNTKETDKLSKHKHLEIEGSKMWKVRTKIVPVIIGTLETIRWD